MATSRWAFQVTRISLFVSGEERARHLWESQSSTTTSIKRIERVKNDVKFLV